MPIFDVVRRRAKKTGFGTRFSINRDHGKSHFRKKTRMAQCAACHIQDERARCSQRCAAHDPVRWIVHAVMIVASAIIAA